MLVGRHRPVSWRIAGILVATVLVTAAGILGAALAAAAGLSEWPPRPSSPFGIFCGFALAAIVLFEMLLLPKKWLRGWRLGSTRLWMWLHVWVGLAGLPVVLVHVGFGAGGPLTSVTLYLFLAVIASGVWGLVMQQWLPQKMLAEVPGETVASQIDHAGEYHAKEAERIIRVAEKNDARKVYAVVIPIGDLDHAVGDPDDPADVELTGVPARELIRFLDVTLLPYLTRGRESHSPLRSRTEAERRFRQLRTELPPEAHPAVDRLQVLTDLRRQWDDLARLNFWLHNWLVLHLPLSVGMTVLMVVHAARALKYW